MGLYINNIGNSFEEKITNLKLKHGAQETSAEFQENLVCVVDNGMFAAAAYCYNQSEFNEFKNTSRRKSWLSVPNANELAQ